MIDLTSLPGIGPGLAERIHRKWPGDSSDRILHEQPYELTQIDGIGFFTADKVAMHLNIAKDSPFRIAAAMKHVLNEAANSQGHTCLPIAELEMRIRDLVGQPPILDAEGFLVHDTFITLERTRDVEQYIAARLLPLCNYEEWTRPIDDQGLAEDQRLALRMILVQKLFVLLGAAGTGKTHMVKALLRNLDAAEMTYALAAPTGKAAKRMEETTGVAAQTIHRLLEAGFDERSGRFFFRRDEGDTLGYDWLIIDESSMIDIRLMQSLLRAVPKDGSMRLLFVGDPWQLPSVGPGDILRDLTTMLSPKGVPIPYATLTTLKRQDPAHRLAANCARVRDGKMVEIDNTNSADFFFADVSRPEEIISTIADLVEIRLPAKYGVRPDQIQVLSALRDKGRVSCKDLNATLRARLNPAAVGTDGFAPGDRVIQTKNDYQLNVMNGECGTVLKLAGRGKLVVKFDFIEEPIEMYPGALEFAWCLTVHKFQGSQAEWTVIPIHDSMGQIVPRNRWIYTAISRGRNCVMVGSREELQKMINRSQDLKRWTLLGRFLENANSMARASV